MKKICVLGLGYIGLPTACLLAANGYQVTGIEPRNDIREKVNKAEAPFSEPGLDKILKEIIKRGQLRASHHTELADAFIIATPTPLEKETKIADLTYVQQAAASIADFLRKGNTVVLESTVPPGTCEKLLLPVLEKTGLKGGVDFQLAHCPERALPGNTLDEMIHNDRIIGGLDENSAEKAKAIYSSFVKGKLYLTNLQTAEMVKLMENTYRDVNIALANEFAQIADETGLNIWEAIELANKHPRVNILHPGPGVGGHCLTKDPWFLIGNSATSKIVSLSREVNDSMPLYVLNTVKELFGGIPKATVTVLGVAYKADVDDTRETPALDFVRMAEKEGYTIKCHDPLVKNFDYPVYSLIEAARDSDCLILMTDHSSFKQIKPGLIGPNMRNRNLVDTRNFLAHDEWRRAGFKVKVLGDGIHHG
jgi:UDP-N-acetyl-D-mannosaminuronic acid dehydrogenase